MNSMNDVVLYSMGCPKCDVLQSKLDRAGIKYHKVYDKWEILSKGYDVLPILEVDGNPLEFSAAVKWVNSYKS